MGHDSVYFVVNELFHVIALSTFQGVPGLLISILDENANSML